MKTKFKLLVFTLCVIFFISCGENSTPTDDEKDEVSNVNPEKEMQDVVDNFQAAFNKEDAEAIKGLFTADAVRTDVDGSVVNGNDSIAKVFADRFAESDATVTITQKTAEAQADGSIHSTGTYHVMGKTSAGETIDRRGNYEVTDVKVDGKWKIKNQVLTSQ